VEQATTLANTSTIAGAANKTAIYRAPGLPKSYADENVTKRSETLTRISNTFGITHAPSLSLTDNECVLIEKPDLGIAAKGMTLSRARTVAFPFT
jgi:hypothetical protein